jgi:hypothetical protein
LVTKRTPKVFRKNSICAELSVLLTGFFTPNALLWGLIDAVIALVALYTGYAILRGDLTGVFLVMSFPSSALFAG